LSWNAYFLGENFQFHQWVCIQWFLNHSSRLPLKWQNFKILMNVSSATTVSGLRMQIYSLPALRRYYFLLKTNIIRMSLTFGKRFSIIAQLSSGELLSITMISPSMVSNAFWTLKHIVLENIGRCNYNDG
jgi:uncharacterized membrane protein